MPPKKGGKKKKGAEPAATAEDVEVLLKIYKKFSADCNIPVYEGLVKKLAEPEELEEFLASAQLLLHPADPADPDEPRLGPGGCRALCTAILGTAPGMEKLYPEVYCGVAEANRLAKEGRPLPFKGLKSLRAWHSRLGDDGACAIAELLRLGGAEVQIEYLELWADGIGARGCRALGVALMVRRLPSEGRTGAKGCGGWAVSGGVPWSCCY